MVAAAGAVRKSTYLASNQIGCGLPVKQRALPMCRPANRKKSLASSSCPDPEVSRAGLVGSDHPRNESMRIRYRWSDFEALFQ